MGEYKFNKLMHGNMKNRERGQFHDSQATRLYLAYTNHTYFGGAIGNVPRILGFVLSKKLPTVLREFLPSSPLILDLLAMEDAMFLFR